MDIIKELNDGWVREREQESLFYINIKTEAFLKSLDHSVPSPSSTYTGWKAGFMCFDQVWVCAVFVPHEPRYMKMHVKLNHRGK